MRLFKTFGRGLLRVTVGLTGIGASVGAKGVRIGRSPSGRKRATMTRGKWSLTRRGR